jgi:uncharacterized protein YkwD
MSKTHVSQIVLVVVVVALVGIFVVPRVPYLIERTQHRYVPVTASVFPAEAYYPMLQKDYETELGKGYSYTSEEESLVVIADINAHRESIGLEKLAPVLSGNLYKCAVIRSTQSGPDIVGGVYEHKKFIFDFPEAYWYAELLYADTISSVGTNVTEKFLGSQAHRDVLESEKATHIAAVAVKGPKCETWAVMLGNANYREK